MIYRNTLQKSLSQVLKQVDIQELGKRQHGKVRDWYDVDDYRVLITTDRQSAFDFNLGFVPYKGAVLNRLSAWWFERVKEIIPSHLVDVIDPNVSVVRRCEPIPVEMIVRGYISGSTKTSLWTAYERGQREIYGMTFPDGLKKNQKLKRRVITPTTHADVGGHDELLTREQIVSDGIVDEELYRQIEDVSLALFELGSQVCEEQGLLLVDTKYEFGMLDGKLCLMDEIHTPDSSRFFVKSSYEKSYAEGVEPEHLDKEFLRLYYREELGFDGVSDPVMMPDDLAVEMARLYIRAYETITGEVFVSEPYPVEERIVSSVNRWKISIERQEVEFVREKESRIKYGHSGK